MISERVRDFLQQPLFAVVATINPDGSPQQTVVWYELRDNAIIMNTTADRQKTRNLKRDSRIDICIRDGYHYVTISGRAQLIDNQKQAQTDVEQLAIRYHGEQAGKAQMAEFSRQQRVTIRVPLDNVHAYRL
jgi:PPOX class probable F420-dependent enzyme